MMGEESEYYELVRIWGEDIVNSVDESMNPVSSLSIYIDAHIAVIRNDYDTLCESLNHFSSLWKHVGDFAKNNLDDGGEKIINRSYTCETLVAGLLDTSTMVYSRTKLRPLFIAQGLLAYRKFRNEPEKLKKAVMINLEPGIAVPVLKFNSSTPTQDLVAFDIQYIAQLPGSGDHEQVGSKLLASSFMYGASFRENALRRNHLQAGRVLHNCAVVFHAINAMNASHEFLNLSQEVLERGGIGEKKWKRLLEARLKANSQLLIRNFPKNTVYPILEPKSLSSMPGLLESVDKTMIEQKIADGIAEQKQVEKWSSITSSTKYLPYNLLRSLLLVSLFAAGYAKIFKNILRVVFLACICLMIGLPCIAEVRFVMILQLLCIGIVAFGLASLDSFYRISLLPALNMQIFRIAFGFSVASIALNCPFKWFLMYMSSAFVIACIGYALYSFAKKYFNPFSPDEKIRNLSRKALLYATIPLAIAQQVVFRIQSRLKSQWKGDIGTKKPIDSTTVTEISTQSHSYHRLFAVEGIAVEEGAGVGEESVIYSVERSDLEIAPGLRRRK